MYKGYSIDKYGQLDSWNSPALLPERQYQDAAVANRQHWSPTGTSKVSPETKSSIGAVFSTTQPTNGRFGKYGLTKYSEKVRVTLRGDGDRVGKILSSSVQDVTCFLVSPPVEACRACHQHAENVGNEACKFKEFRVLWGAEGLLNFCKDDHYHDDMSLWLPLACCSLSREAAIYIFRSIYAAFEKIYNEETRCLQRFKFKGTNIPWKPTTKYASEKCDVCKKCIFNFNFVCEACGFTACIACSNRGKLNWPVCSDGETHNIEEFFLAKLIPGNSLTELHNRVQTIMSSISSVTGRAVHDSNDVKYLTYSVDEGEILNEFREEWTKEKPVVIVGVPLKKGIWKPLKKGDQDELAAQMNDLEQNFPLSSYTLHNGVFNIGNRVPTVLSDVDAKVIVSSAKLVRCKKDTSSFCLHSSDYAGVITKIASRKDDRADVASVLDDMNFDKKDMDYVNGRGTKKLGAVWRIWGATDVNLTMQAFSEIKEKEEHNFVINLKLMERIQKKYNLRQYQCVQLERDTVFIPAGHISYVLSLRESLVAYCLFVSPENVHKSLQLEDDEQNYRSVIYHAMKDCVAVLSMY